MAKSADNGTSPKSCLTLDSIADAPLRSHLSDLCSQYRSHSEDETLAKNAKAELMKEIRPLAERLGVKLDLSLLGDGWELVQRENVGEYIDAVTLAELGIPVDVIKAATKERRTPYYTVVAKSDKSDKSKKK